MDALGTRRTSSRRGVSSCCKRSDRRGTIAPLAAMSGPMRYGAIFVARSQGRSMKGRRSLSLFRLSSSSRVKTLLAASSGESTHPLSVFGYGGFHLLSVARSYVSSCSKAFTSVQLLPCGPEKRPEMNGSTHPTGLRHRCALCIKKRS